MASRKAGWISQDSLPLEVELSIGCGAISKVKVDEALIRDSYALGYGFEVVDALFIQPNRDLFLELRNVGILGRF